MYLYPDETQIPRNVNTFFSNVFSGYDSSGPRYFSSLTGLLRWTEAYRVSYNVKGKILSTAQVFVRLFDNNVVWRNSSQLFIGDSAKTVCGFSDAPRHYPCVLKRCGFRGEWCTQRKILSTGTHEQSLEVQKYWNESIKLLKMYGKNS